MGDGASDPDVGRWARGNFGGGAGWAAFHFLSCFLTPGRGRLEPAQKGTPVDARFALFAPAPPALTLGIQKLHDGDEDLQEEAAT